MDIGIDKYAITRPEGYGSCKSAYLAKIINKFGEKKGFDLIMEKIKDEKNWCSIDFVTNIINAFGNFHGLFFRSFALEYINKFKDACFRNILESPESNLRNFSKEKIDSIFQSLGKLIKRSNSLGEKYEVNIIKFIVE